MRRLLRAALLPLALLMPLLGMRAAPASRCPDGCDLPCCDRDDAHSTMLPVLPCCRTDSLGRASIHPAPTTLESGQGPLVWPSVVVSPLVAIAAPASLPPAGPRLLPAPPLYHRHCALLL